VAREPLRSAARPRTRSVPDLLPCRESRNVLFSQRKAGGRRPRRRYRPIEGPNPIRPTGPTEPRPEERERKRTLETEPGPPGIRAEPPPGRSKGNRRRAVFRKKAGQSAGGVSIFGASVCFCLARVRPALSRSPCCGRPRNGPGTRCVPQVVFARWSQSVVRAVPESRTTSMGTWHSEQRDRQASGDPETAQEERDANDAGPTVRVETFSEPAPPGGIR
jgi:hypothetical protein